MRCRQNVLCRAQAKSPLSYLIITPWFLSRLQVWLGGNPPTRKLVLFSHSFSRLAQSRNYGERIRTRKRQKRILDMSLFTVPCGRHSTNVALRYNLLGGSLAFMIPSNVLKWKQNCHQIRRGEETRSDTYFRACSRR